MSIDAFFLVVRIGAKEAAPAPGHVTFTDCMLLGRLELYTVLIVLLPAYWRK